MIKIAIVDDEKYVCEHLKQLLNISSNTIWILKLIYFYHAKIYLKEFNLQ